MMTRWPLRSEVVERAFNIVKWEHRHLHPDHRFLIGKLKVEQRTNPHEHSNEVVDCVWLRDDGKEFMRFQISLLTAKLYIMDGTWVPAEEG